MSLNLSSPRAFFAAAVFGAKLAVVASVEGDVEQEADGVVEREADGVVERGRDWEEERA